MDRDWLIRKHNDLRGWLWGLVPGLALIALLSVLGHGIWVAFFFFAMVWPFLGYYLFLLFRGFWRGWRE